MRKWPWSVGITVVFVLFIAWLIAGYGFQQGWTGLPEHPISNPQKYQPAKSVWDLLNLLGVLAIPVVAGFGVAWYTTKQTQASEAASEQQRQTELEKAEQQRKSELEVAEKRYKTELEIAADNQREALLQTYIDKISELLLANNLRESVEDEVRNIARVRTLAVLPRLDPIRKASVLQFLGEAGLILKDRKIIDLHGADLSHVELRNFSLYEANLIDFPLRNADLSFANLSFANLSGTDLSCADLSFANLRYANLSEANLCNADLRCADLHHADLSGSELVGNLHEDAGVKLNGANLSEANLRDIGPGEVDYNDPEFDDNSALYMEEVRGALNYLLNEAKSLNGATMPDGSIHP